jgi:hypothetical protein
MYLQPNALSNECMCSARYINTQWACLCFATGALALTSVTKSECLPCLPFVWQTQAGFGAAAGSFVFFTATAQTRQLGIATKERKG